MTVNKKPDVQNKNPNSSPETSLTGNETGLTSIGKVIAAVNEVKARQAENSKASETLVGIVLMTSPPLAMSVGSFAKIYPDDKSFYKSVVQKDGKSINPKKDAIIKRAYCYVPEVSGALPFPDLKKVKAFLRLWNESDKPKDVSKQEKYMSEREKEIIKMYPDLYKEFQKVVMHPIFYKYTETNFSISPLEFVTVKFTQDFDTYHAGVIEQCHGDFFKPN